MVVKPLIDSQYRSSSQKLGSQAAAANRYF